MVLPIEPEELLLVTVLLAALELDDLPVELRVTVRFPDELLAEVAEELFVLEPEDTLLPLEPLDLVTVLPVALLLLEEAEPDDVPLLTVELNCPLNSVLPSAFRLSFSLR